MQNKYNLIILMCLFFTLLLSLKAFRKEPRYYLNLSNSEPVGIYKLLPFDGHLKVGDLVVFKVPEKAASYIYGRGWLPDGWPLIKNVGALPGDKVIISDSSLKINDVDIGPVFNKDHKGKFLPKLRGEIDIPEGYFLPISTVIQNSFDGRYFGAVSLSAIKGKVLLIHKF